MKKTTAFFMGIVLNILIMPHAWATNIYAGATYETSADGKTDRQQYNPASMSFFNTFGSKHDISGGLGYILGIGTENFALEYRNINETITRFGTESRFRHSNILLIGKSNTGTRRPKIGIGYGTAVSPGIGNTVIATDVHYTTTSYLFGLDFVPGGGDLEDTKHGFFADYVTTIAHSRTFRTVSGGVDISARENIRYSKFVFGYIFRFGTTQ